MRVVVFLLAISAVLSGCDSPTDVSQPDYFPDVRASTAGAAAAALGPDGLFDLPRPDPLAGRPAIITPERAVELVEAWRASYLRGTAVFPIHGGPIDWDRTSPYGDRGSFFLQGIYQPLSEDLPDYVRMSMGPVYAVPLLVDGRAVAMISVVAHGTHLRIRDDGTISGQEMEGVEFHMIPIPATSDVLLPPSPEQAVASVTSIVGIPVIEVPRLIQPKKPITPSAGLWEIVLEAPAEVEVIATGTTLRVDTVFVSGRLEKSSSGRWSAETRFFIPKSRQPTSYTLNYISESGDEQRQTVVDYVPGLPVAFREVRLGRPG